MITVVRITGDKVRIGIEAPRDMIVLRDELEPLKLEATTKLPEPGLSKLGLSKLGLSEPETTAVHTTENLYEATSIG